MIVIPAIDLLDSRVVRLKKGDYNQVTFYDTDPLDLAQSYSSMGFTHIHLVDLDGSRIGGFHNLDTVRKIASNTSLIIDYGGGIRSLEAIERAFDAGCSQVSLASFASLDPQGAIKALEKWGPGRLILGADCLDGIIRYSGWKIKARDDVKDYVKYFVSMGFETVICTDISKDGMLKGLNLDLYKMLLKQNKTLRLIGSGGVSCLEDLEKAREINLWGCIAGKALLEGLIDPEEAICLQNA